MTLYVEIINSQNALCQHECGLDWSNPEVRTGVAVELIKRFGDCIRIKYSSTASSPSTGARSLLKINGQVRLTGAFDKREVIEIIETQLEVGGGSDGRE
jgi:hypothetical protein